MFTHGLHHARHATHATHATHAAHATHATHAAHAVVMRITTGRAFRLFGDLGHQRRSGQQQAGHAGGVLQSGTHYLGRIDDASFHQVAVASLFRRCSRRTCPSLRRTRFTTTAPSKPAFSAMARSGYSSTLRTILTPSCSSPSSVSLSSAFSARSRATPPPGTIPSSRAAWVAAAGVFEQRLPLFHFRFRRGTTADLSHATGQLGQTLLQLFSIVIAVRLFDLTPDLVRAALNILLAPGTADHDRLVGRDANPLGPSQVGQFDALQINSQSP